ncbi:MAG: NAD-dependent epimerase/dehydratase family protein, partial [Acidobacteriota bacterium]
MMIRKNVVLITGASGEIGHGLIENIAAAGQSSIITVDLQPLAPELKSKVTREFTGSIMEDHLLQRILAEFEVETIFHLAALLSTRAEFTPVAAHQV